MGYKLNTKHWNVGDLVLHNGDSKRPEMLMRVIGYTKDGWCLTRYLGENRGTAGFYKKTWKNHVSVLQDPADFGVVPPSAITAEQGKGRKWHLVFDDWQKLGKSIYATELGLALSTGDLHSGTAFTVDIDLPEDVAREIITAAAEYGAHPVFRLLPAALDEPT